MNDDKQDTCQLCSSSTGKYVCPRCNLLYCSVTCYKSEKHLQCSETFYENCVKEELAAQEKDPDMIRKMLEILKEEATANDENERLDSDDEDEAIELSERLANVDLENSEAVWENLTPAEQKGFKKFVSSGEFIDIIPDWKPWWQQKTKLVVEESEESSTTPPHPSVPDIIPPLSSLTKFMPSLSMPYMVFNVLLSYVFTARWLKGQHAAVPVQAATTVLTLSATLNSGQVFEDMVSAYISFEDNLKKCPWVRSKDGVKVCEDVADVLQGQPSDPQVFVKAALCDLQATLLEASSAIKSCKEGPSFSGQPPSVRDLKLAAKKTAYYLSWVLWTSHVDVFTVAFNMAAEWEPEITGDIKVITKILCPKGATCVSYSDNLQYMITGQEDGSIECYEGNTLARVLEDCDTKQEMEPVTDIKMKATPRAGFHRTAMASYISGNLKLWNLASGKCIYTIFEDRRTFGLNYHSRLKKFVTFGNTKRLNVYDEETRTIERYLSASELLGSTNGHSDWVCAAMFQSLNWYELVSAGLDTTLQFWDLRAPYAVKSINCGAVYGDGIDVNYAGTEVLTCSADAKCTTRIWDTRTDQLLTEIQLERGSGYAAKWITPEIIAVSSFFSHLLRLVHVPTKRVLGCVSQLRSCPMSFSVFRHKRQHRVDTNTWSKLAFITDNFVLEIAPRDKEDP